MLPPQAGEALDPHPSGDLHVRSPAEPVKVTVVSQNLD
jgi:hypothetical protein